MADNEAAFEGKHRVQPRLPEVGIFPPESFGESVVVGGVEVEWFVVGDEEE